MSDFHIGQKIVYIGKCERDPKVDVGFRVNRNEIYTVRKLGWYTKFLTGPAAGVWLQEGNRDWLANPIMNVIWRDIPWGAPCFRPLEPKSIEIFRQIARDVTQDAKRKERA